MRRFVLQQNVVRFQRALETERDESTCRSIREILAACKRELALLESALHGAYAEASLASFAERNSSRSDRTFASLFQKEFEDSSRPYLVLDPRPGLHIVDINDAYGRATLTRRTSVAGRPLFEVFPDNPGDPDADGVSNLYASLRAASDSGREHAMQVQRYDMRDPNGRFIEHYWRTLNTPLLDEDGRLKFLVHHVEDVTAEVLALPAASIAR
jgi:PAS domain-containing protein